jgi:hypothetical protein
MNRDLSFPLFALVHAPPKANHRSQKCSLRIIVRANEHMGQLIAYAPMTGVAPPWSKKD